MCYGGKTLAGSGPEQDATQLVDLHVQVWMD